jgi:hypothetical protein
MSLPAVANTTFDLYHPPNAPPANPDAAAVPCRLDGAYDRGLDHGTDPIPNHYDYVLLCDLTVDIRDGYNMGSISGPIDLVYSPDRNGVLYKVVFVERVGRGTAWDHKRVYLVRSTVNWGGGGPGV